MQELIKELEELKEKKRELWQQIRMYDDGFKYTVIVCSYGSNWEFKPTNSYVTKDHMNKYNGDNGIVSLITNNVEFAKKVDDEITSIGGSVTIIE